MSHCLFCGVCASETLALKVCTKCKSARYCDVACQRLDWVVHKTQCARGSASPSGLAPAQIDAPLRYVNPRVGLVFDDAERQALKPIRELAGLSAPCKTLLKTLSLVPATGCELVEVADGIDMHSWTAAAVQVKECGGQLVFGWTLLEGERAVVAEPCVARFEAGEEEDERFWGANAVVFYPDARVRDASREHGKAPPVAVYWK